MVRKQQILQKTQLCCGKTLPKWLAVFLCVVIALTSHGGFREGLVGLGIYRPSTGSGMNTGQVGE